MAHRFSGHPAFTRFKPIEWADPTAVTFYALNSGRNHTDSDWLKCLFDDYDPNDPPWKAPLFSVDDQIEAVRGRPDPWNELWTNVHYIRTAFPWLLMIGNFNRDWDKMDQLGAESRLRRKFGVEWPRKKIARSAFNAIPRADFVVGVVRPDNPIAWVELGIAVALNKPIFLHDEGGMWGYGDTDNWIPAAQIEQMFVEYQNEFEYENLWDFEDSDDVMDAGDWGFFEQASRLADKRKQETPTPQVSTERGEDMFGNAYSQLRQQSKLGAIPALTHQLKIPHTRYSGDWGNRKLRAIIEIDEDHHRQRREFEADKKRQREIELLGWRVWRFTEREVLADPEGCARQAAAFLTTLTE
jgi:very-short-patch-repair endonuclease/nucleoside 2-deoxyribosyltransferase